MKREDAPAGDDATEEGGFGEVCARVEAERGLHFAEAVGREVNKVRVFELMELGVGGLFVEVDAVPGEEFAEVETIDGGERVETE